MRKSSGKAKLVRKTAEQIREPAAADLERLRRVVERRVDTSEAPELLPGTKRVQRDAQGRPPRFHRGPVSLAILNELGRREMTRYELWRRAREHCGSLPESAVYEFLRGQRQIGVVYLEAIMAALDLSLRPARATRASARPKRRLKHAQASQRSADLKAGRPLRGAARAAGAGRTGAASR